MGTMANI